MISEWLRNVRQASVGSSAIDAERLAVTIGAPGGLIVWFSGLRTCKEGQLLASRAGQGVEASMRAAFWFTGETTNGESNEEAARVDERGRASLEDARARENENKRGCS
jgi:hypothetical protein